MHHRDVLIGQLLAGIQGHQFGIIPFDDGAHEHFGQHCTSDTQFSRLKSGQVDHRNCATNDGWELYLAVFVQIRS